MGNSITGITKAAPRRFKIPNVNIRYLNTNRRPRLRTTAHTTAGLSLWPRPWAAATHRPKAQLARMEAIITSTNQGSPQA